MKGVTGLVLFFMVIMGNLTKILAKQENNDNSVIVLSKSGNKEMRDKIDVKAYLQDRNQERQLSLKKMMFDIKKKAKKDNRVINKIKIGSNVKNLFGSDDIVKEVHNIVNKQDLPERRLSLGSTYAGSSFGGAMGGGPPMMVGAVNMHAPIKVRVNRLPDPHNHPSMDPLAVEKANLEKQSMGLDDIEEKLFDMNEAVEGYNREIALDIDDKYSKVLQLNA